MKEMLPGFSGQGQWGCEGSVLRSCSLQTHYLMAGQQPFARVSSHAPFSGRGLQAGSGASLGPPLLGRASLCDFPSLA